MKRTAARLWFTALLVAAGCGSDFDKASLVEGLRVLAVSADPPSAGPQDIAIFTPLVHAGDGTVTYAWSLCAVTKAPTSGYECAVDEVPLGADATAKLPVASLVAQAQQVADETGFTVDLDKGVTVYVRLKVSTPDDAIEAVKRLTITTREPRNANPTLTGLERDGEPWAADEVLEVEESKELALLPRAAGGAAETWLDGDGKEQKEELLYAWFATAGGMKQAFSFDAEPGNRWTAPALKDDEATKDVTLWLVVRDGRGGTGWLQRTARVMPKGATQ